MSPDPAAPLRRLLAERVEPHRLRWLDEAVAAAGRDPSALAVTFPAVGRQLGRQPLDPGGDEHGWTVDDAGRVLLLLAATAAGGPALPPADLPPP